MTTIQKYRARDGREFENHDKARNHEALLDAIDKVMLPLSPEPTGDQLRRGWVQHDLAKVIACKQGILDLAKLKFGKSFKAFHAPAKDVHPLSIVGRVLSDSDSPLNKPWSRFCRIDEQGREHQQCYYAYTNGPEREHVCVEDRR